MNAVAGPFLYCMGELDAYFAFSKFIKIYCPMYWVPQMFGARAGCHLIDRCLKIVDEELFIYLRKRNLFATLYAFARTNHNSFIGAFVFFYGRCLQWCRVSPVAYSRSRRC